MSRLDHNRQMGTGIRALDRDHLEQHETILEIRGTLACRRNSGRIALLLHGLERTLTLHFALEEGLMRAAQYPGLVHHTREHIRLTECLRALASLHDRGRINLVEGSLDFLSEDHARHIRQNDRRYGSWLSLDSGEDLERRDRGAMCALDQYRSRNSGSTGFSNREASRVTMVSPEGVTK